MIQDVIAHINTQIEGVGLFQTRLGLIEQIKQTNTNKDDVSVERMFPAEYCTKGEYEQIDIDNHKGIVYHRKNGEVTTDFTEDGVEACDNLQTITFPIKMICAVKRDVLTRGVNDAFVDDKIAQTVRNAITVNNESSLNKALGADTVMIQVTSWNTDRYTVWDGEYDNVDMGALFEYAYLSIDYDIAITAPNSCFTSYDCEFTVAQLGAQIWLNGDVGLTLRSSGGSEFASAWGDESGSGNGFVQATAGNQPKYHANIFNGHGAIEFADTTDLMVTTSTPIINQAEISMYIIIKAPFQAPGVLLSFGPTAGAGGILTTTGTNATNSTFLVNAVLKYLGGLYTDDTLCIQELIYSSTDAISEASINGVSLADVAGDEGVLNNVNTYQIGTAGNPSFMAELIIFNRRLTLTERNQLVSSLGSKYNISVSTIT